MQNSFLPPPSNQSQGNTMMNFSNGLSHQQGPNGDQLSNQFSNIELNNDSHSAPPQMQPPSSFDMGKFNTNPIIPPSGIDFMNNLHQKPPGMMNLSQSSGTPNLLLSNASAPVPLPSQLQNVPLQNNSDPRLTENIHRSQSQYGPPQSGSRPPSQPPPPQSGSRPPSQPNFGGIPNSMSNIGLQSRQNTEGFSSVNQFSSITEQTGFSNNLPQNSKSGMNSSNQPIGQNFEGNQTLSRNEQNSNQIGLNQSTFQNQNITSASSNNQISNSLGQNFENLEMPKRISPQNLLKRQSPSDGMPNDIQDQTNNRPNVLGGQYNQESSQQGGFKPSVRGPFQPVISQASKPPEKSNESTPPSFMQSPTSSARPSFDPSSGNQFQNSFPQRNNEIMTPAGFVGNQMPGGKPMNTFTPPSSEQSQGLTSSMSSPPLPGFISNSPQTSNSGQPQMSSGMSQQGQTVPQHIGTFPGAGPNSNFSGPPPSGITQQGQYMPSTQQPNGSFPGSGPNPNFSSTPPSQGMPSTMSNGPPQFGMSGSGNPPQHPSAQQIMNNPPPSMGQNIPNMPPATGMSNGLPPLPGVTSGGPPPQKGPQFSNPRQKYPQPQYGQSPQQPQQSQLGYPRAASQAPSFPNSPPQANYPGATQQSFPGSPPHPGFQGTSQPSGFPGGSPQSNFQSQPPMSGGMPPMPSGMPPMPSGMPPMSSGMPPMSSGIPPNPSGMPPMPGSMQSQGYPPNSPQQQYSGSSQGGYQPGGGYSQDPYGGSNNMQYPNSRPQPAPAKKLDPDNMPSRIQVMIDDRQTRSGVFKTDARGGMPPLVTTQFTVQDYGNCSPRFVRSTMYSVPTTNDLMKQVGVPFGIVISPLANVNQDEIEPPSSDFRSNGGPVRCNRCKAYMNPFMQFIDGGRRYQCFFCKAPNDVPEEYFQHLDHLGQRSDKYNRAELCMGSYEFLVPEQYCRDSKFPNPPALIFIIDVSYNTVKSGLINLLCQQMLSIVNEINNDKIKIGFITYANSVQFYNIKPNLVKPEIMEVTDVDDMFMPFLDGFLATPSEATISIQSIMEQIPIMFRDTKETETILLPAIQAGMEALKASETVGKLLVFHASLPIYEAPGKLKNRDDRKMLGTDKEKTVLTPQDMAYNNLGQECVNNGVGVDLFIFNNAYIDLATIGQVSRLTGGEIYKYTYFQAGLDGERLINDIRKNITRPTGFDAVMRVRTSTGVRPTDFYGHLYMGNTTDMEIPTIDCDKSIAIEIKHDDKLVPEEGLLIQVALLYTSNTGVRKVRIHNLSLNCTNQMAEIYRYCELDTLINYFSKQASFKLLENSPKAVKEALILRTATILSCYRKHCASPGSSLGQLILPECLKLLPLYVNSLLKCDAISGGPEMSIDDRSFAMYSTHIMDIPSSVVYFYPHLISLHDVDPDADDCPVQLRCSFEKLKPDGAYLLDNTIHMFLWIGQNVSNLWVEQVFGVPTVGHIDTDKGQLPELNNPISRRVNDIIDYIRATRPRSMRMSIVRQRDKLEVVIRQFLIEDRGQNETQQSYVDFLCHIHKEIRSQLS